VERPHQGWATDITSIRIERGFAYLVAVMDGHSRKGLAWRLSNTLATEFWVEALQEALRRFGPPEIFHTDPGRPFTRRDFTGGRQAQGIRLSLDGKGRALDNLFVEWLWRSVKYEEVYLKPYETLREAREGVSAYFRFYNTERPPQALGHRTPAEVYEAAGIPIPAVA
jgi:putative transposase